MPETSPGRPRDSAVEARVYEATLGLLRHRGYTRLRIDDIATTASVAKTTIYRRWPSLSVLVLDALESALGTADDTDDLAGLVTAMHERVVDNPLAETVRAVGADLIHQPELAADYRRRFVDPLRDRAIALITQGQQTGAYRADIDPTLVVDALIGAIIYRGLIAEPMPDREQLLGLGTSLLRPR